MTGSSLHSSRKRSSTAAGQLTLDREAVATRIAAPSLPGAGQTVPYMAGVSFAEAIAAVGSTRKRLAKRTKPPSEAA